MARFNVSQPGAPDVATRTGLSQSVATTGSLLIEESHAPGSAYSLIPSRKTRPSDAESGGGPSRTMT